MHDAFYLVLWTARDSLFLYRTCWLRRSPFPPAGVADFVICFPLFFTVGLGSEELQEVQPVPPPRASRVWASGFSKGRPRKAAGTQEGERQGGLRRKV